MGKCYSRIVSMENIQQQAEEFNSRITMMGKSSSKAEERCSRITVMGEQQVEEAILDAISSSEALSLSTAASPHDARASRRNDVPICGSLILAYDHHPNNSVGSESSDSGNIHTSTPLATSGVNDPTAGDDTRTDKVEVSHIYGGGAQFDGGNCNGTRRENSGVMMARDDLEQGKEEQTHTPTNLQLLTNNARKTVQETKELLRDRLQKADTLLRENSQYKVPRFAPQGT